MFAPTESKNNRPKAKTIEMYTRLARMKLDLRGGEPARVVAAGNLKYNGSGSLPLIT
jgi:hypothetical protein